MDGAVRSVRMILGVGKQSRTNFVLSGCQHTSFYRLKNPRQVICDILPRDPSIAVNVDI
jgi:hypothetical protein